MKKKLLLIAPHLSTGGAPQFTLNKIEMLLDEYEIFCIEYSFMSGDFVVQRNKIINLLNDNFFPLYDDKNSIIGLIDKINPDIISMEEFPENFMNDDIAKYIYREDRTYTIFETTHSSFDRSKDKKTRPDKFIFVSQHSANVYQNLGIEYEVIEYPIDKKIKNRTTAIRNLGLDPNYKHVVNIGLFTEGKNQGYIFELARRLLNYDIQFHFIGNQAENFRHYWEPILQNRPENCIIWGERTDIDNFLHLNDLFLFTSKFELNPLVIKEALMYDSNILMFNLGTYCGVYDNVENIKFLTDDIDNDIKIIIEKLELSEFNGHYDFIEVGTSDFDTIIEDCNEHSRGISIEPLKVYLDRLPNRPNVFKEASALSNKDGFVDLHYIPFDKINEHGIINWVKGCNSIGKDHKFTIETIGKELYDELSVIEQVPSISWNTLIEKYKIKSIDILKIDTEGYENVILEEYFNICKNNPNLLANRILFEFNENSNTNEITNILKKVELNYNIEYLDDDVLLIKKHKYEKGYVLYTNEKYFDITKTCVESLREFSDLPIFVYVMNSDLIIDIENVFTIRWNFDSNISKDMYKSDNDNFYINRTNDDIYKLLIQRPLIVKDALMNHCKTVVYVDSDSVATPYVDNIFNYYNESYDYPFFVEGVYDYLFIGTRGMVETRDELHLSLEYPCCELFSVDQNIRDKYRQTGYFISNENCIDFLDEWYWMCINPKILSNVNHYAAFNEETVLNTLLWKHKILIGLPYIYINGSDDLVDEIYDKDLFNGEQIEIGSWKRLPRFKEELLFFHGEKNIEKMKLTIKKLKENENISRNENRLCDDF